MSTEFETFDVTREIAAAPETVYRLWTDPELKPQWFAWDTPDGWHTDSYTADLVEGGTERAVFRNAQASQFTYAARLIQLRPNARLIYSYTMASQDQMISASLSTVTLAAGGKGTRLIYTEQIVFLDEGDRLEYRLAGTEDLLNRMERHAEAAHADV